LNYLLDTNVISEARRTRPHPHVQAWFGKIDPAALFISVLTLGEIAKGIAMRARRNEIEAAAYQRWLEATRTEYVDRIVAIDDDIAERWGRLSAQRSIPVVDGLLAATAFAKGMTFVTRNIRDVASTGVPVLDPWQT
jgi:toxin FitB